MKRKSKNFSVCMKEYPYTFGLSKRVLQTLLLMILFVPSLLAVDIPPPQSTEIRGTVTDKKTGETIIGATIQVKGTTTGVASDLDGAFSIKAEASSMLVISYIGYHTQEIAVGANKVFSIQLEEDTKSLDEVVVVGFGTQKKVNLTGAVSTVGAKSLESRPVVNASQALQGMVPGLFISSSSGNLESRPDISIRGIATIGEGSSGGPLILIDGMEGDINAINPQDIENISVLKDVAASSIYGSRAPFGVILVTTKSGQSGKTVVNYNNNFRYNTPVSTPEMMDSYTFATYFNDAGSNAGLAEHFSPEHLQRILDYQNGVISESIVPNPGNPQQWADGYAYGNDNADWYDALFRQWTFSHEHNVSLSGGSEKTQYYVSMNYLDQGGVMKINQDTYDRYTVTAKINTELTDWLKMNFSSRFTREDYARPSSMTDWLWGTICRQGWPTLPLYDPNGFYYDSPSPALSLATGGRDRSQADNIYQQAKFILAPIKGGVTNVDLNYRIKSVNRHWDSQMTYNHDVDGNPVLKNSGSKVHEGNMKENYMNINAYTEYAFSIKEMHNFRPMIGFQSEALNKTDFGLQRSGIIIPDLPWVDLTTGSDVNGNPITPSVNGSGARWSTVGFFGRINYDYDGRYLAEVNLRYDGTSRFRPDQRWNLSPSFSLGWNIARESFWEPIADYVGTFKIRGSYGELGNQNTASWYPTYQVMSLGISNGGWIQDGVRPNTATVPNLISSTMGWESVKSWNVGFDFGALNNRLTGSFDYYNRFTLDMIGPAPTLPGILGIGVPKTNNTDLKTYGFDLNISWNDRIGKVGYGVKFILSDSQTEITRYPNETGDISGDKHYVGKKLGTIWGYETIDIARTQGEMDSHLASMSNGAQDGIGNKWEAGDIMYKDLNGDGKIDNGAQTLENHGDLKIIGNSTARYQFGLDLTADWKGIDIRAFFQGVMKRDFFQKSEYFWGVRADKWNSAGLVEHTDYFRAEESNHLAANLDAYYPRPLFNTSKNQQSQTKYLQDASYIRLKNLQVGYTLPSVLLQKIGVSKVRVFVSGENLWTGTKMASMFDPETVGGGYYNNGNAYPLNTTVSFGLSLTL